MIVMSVYDLLQLKHLQSVMKKHDAEVLSLEEDKVRMKKVGSFYVFYTSAAD